MIHNEIASKNIDVFLKMIRVAPAAATGCVREVV
jgi:hypothetical protein